MKCCAPAKNSTLAIKAAACCHMEAATETLSSEAAQISLIGDAGKHLAQVVAQNLAQDASTDAILARSDSDSSSLNHREPVPTYLLGRSFLR